MIYQFCSWLRYEECDFVFKDRFSGKYSLQYAIFCITVCKNVKSNGKTHPWNIYLLSLLSKVFPVHSSEKTLILQQKKIFVCNTKFSNIKPISEGNGMNLWMTETQKLKKDVTFAFRQVSSKKVFYQEMCGTK